MKLPIYLDNHATTPVDPRVLQEMLPFLTSEFGNAASKSHPFGWNAGKVVESGRARIASFIGAKSEELVFTSGATESNNIALKGAFEIYGEKGNHIITQVTEHKSILDTCKYLEKQGARVTYLGVDSNGQIRLDELKAAINDKTILISIMFANNEIGTIQPIAQIGKMAKEKGVLFHADCAQASGRIAIDVEALGIDILSLSAHKVYGPKGIGALYVRSEKPHVRLAPVIHGGGHERGLRSGTLNVPAIAGFAKACEIAAQEMLEENKRIAALRDRLKKGIEQGVDGVYLNGHPAERLVNNLNLSFFGIEGEALMMALTEDLAVSSGSACSSGSMDVSHVLKALNLPVERLHSAIRFGVGRFNTEEEIDYAIGRVIEMVRKLRAHSPVYQASSCKKENTSV